MPPTNSCSANFTLDGYLVRQPTLIPTCLLAAVIGITGFVTITRLAKTLSNPLYRISFLSYACMMTSSMIVNCLLPNLSQDQVPTGIALYVSLIDLGLTSSIAYSFGINGLIDSGLLKPLSLLTYMLFFGGFGACFGGWIYIFTSGWWMGTQSPIYNKILLL